MHRHNLNFEELLGRATPGRRRPPTPIRNPKSFLNKENHCQNHNHEFTNPHHPKKPLISPMRNIYKEEDRVEEEMVSSVSVEEKGLCSNHPHKQAEFEIEIDGESMKYCNKCGAQLASQGFEVHRIEPSTVKKGLQGMRRSDRMKKSVGYPEYEGNLMYEVILQFLTDLSEVEKQHLLNMKKLSEVDQNYEMQVEQTNMFYLELMEFMQQMREDHLADLREESKKHSQIADIEHDYLRENIDEMAKIRADIEDNLHTIVENLDEHDLRSNLNFYRQKIEVYRQKVEDQAEFFHSLIAFTPTQYTHKLHTLQAFMIDVWAQEKDQEQDRHIQDPAPEKVVDGSRMNNQRKRQIDWRGSHGEQEMQQPAFRRLFDEEELGAETSPQFKKF